jgi:ribosomal protein L29
MKKKQQLIEISKLSTREMLKKLDTLKQKLQQSQTKIITGKSSQTSQIRQLRIQIAQIKTLINQRILENLKERQKDAKKT